METFIIFHYRYHRDLWTKTQVQAADEASARKAFYKVSDDNIISILTMRS